MVKGYLFFKITEKNEVISTDEETKREIGEVRDLCVLLRNKLARVESKLCICQNLRMTNEQLTKLLEGNEVCFEVNGCNICIVPPKKEVLV